MNAKKVEIQAFGMMSLLKMIGYLSILPIGLILLVCLVMLLAGIVKGSFGMVFSALFSMLFPLFLLLLYGGLMALSAWIYNLLAKRYGGLHLTLVEVPQKTPALFPTTSGPVSQPEEKPVVHSNVSNPMLSNPYSENIHGVNNLASGTSEKVSAE